MKAGTKLESLLSMLRLKESILKMYSCFLLCPIKMQKIEVLFGLFVVVVVVLFSEQKLLPCTLDRPKPPPSHPHTFRQTKAYNDDQAQCP